MADPQFTNDESTRQYELRLDGKVAALAQYELHGGTVRFIHTEVLPEHEGKGLGSKLARQALDDVRARGLQAQLVCPFMAGYVKKHPEYADLVAR